MNWQAVAIAEQQRSAVEEKREWHVIMEIQGFIFKRPYQVMKDGTGWIYTAAVHYLCKGSTMSIPQLADDAHYGHASKQLRISCMMTWLSNINGHTCAAGVVTKTTDRDSLRYTYNGTRRVRQLALGCKSNWVKSTHDAYENTWKCGELNLNFSPSAEGWRK